MRLKSSEDQDIYNRYKDGHDGTMSGFIDRWENGQDSEDSYGPPEMTELQTKAYDVVSKMKPNYSYKELQEELGIYPTILHRILNKRWNKIKDHWLHKAASYEYDLPELEDDSPTQEQEKKAIQLLKEAGAEENLKRFCRKHDLPYKPVYCTVKGRYATVHKVVEEIIRKLG